MARRAAWGDAERSGHGRGDGPGELLPLDFRLAVKIGLAYTLPLLVLAFVARDPLPAWTEPWIALGTLSTYLLILTVPPVRFARRARGVWPIPLLVNGFLGHVWGFALAYELSPEPRFAPPPGMEPRYEGGMRFEIVDPWVPPDLFDVIGPMAVYALAAAASGVLLGAAARKLMGLLPAEPQTMTRISLRRRGTP